MSNLSKKLEDELAEFLYTGVAEFSGIENGNFLLARKILTLSSFRSIIEKVERYDRFFESLGIGEYDREEFISKVIRANRLNPNVKAAGRRGARVQIQSWGVNNERQ
ncbi:MAG: hypothetical protein DDT23_01348 [candidate division WS2 bacterium]|nr:hypothetical protein [Candidatus Lithacetigena glycinireducens]